MTGAQSDDDDGTKTPSSLVSSPRETDLVSPVRPRKARVSPIAKKSLPQKRSTVEAVDAFCDIVLSARRMTQSAEGIHGVTRIVRDHIDALHSDNTALRTEASRQKQALDIFMTEKHCEMKMMQSEAAAYRMAAIARTATVQTLEESIARLVKENEANKALLEAALADGNWKTLAIKEADASVNRALQRIEELESLVSSLQRELQQANAQEAATEREGAHLTTASLLHSAREDAAAAAEQLIEACDENSRLMEKVSLLEEELECRNAAEAEHRRQEAKLKATVRHLEEENAALRERNTIGNTARTNTYSTASPLPPVSASISGSGGNATVPTPLVSSADPEDLLAMEMSRLRQENRLLEDKLAAVRLSAPVAQTLEREVLSLRADNSKLIDAVRRSATEAESAKREVADVRSTAQELSRQLLTAIGSITASVVDQPATTACTPSGDRAEALQSTNKNITMDHIPDGDVGSSLKVPGTIESWGGPPTPTSDVIRSTAVARTGRPWSDSSTDSAILRDLRIAMEVIDPVGVTDARPLSEHTPSFTEVPKAPLGSATPVVMDELKLISQRIAALGRHGNYHEAPCVTIAPHGSPGVSGEKAWHE